jgi:hypothetical protein
MEQYWKIIQLKIYEFLEEKQYVFFFVNSVVGIDWW